MSLKELEEILKKKCNLVRLSELDNFVCAIPYPMIDAAKPNELTERETLKKAANCSYLNKNEIGFYRLNGRMLFCYACGLEKLAYKVAKKKIIL